MEFVDKVFATFAMLIGAGFAVYLTPIMDGMIIPALNNAGMYGIIAWGPYVIPVVYNAMIFVVIFVIFIKIWRSSDSIPEG
jgi:hypothetical protein